MFAITTPIYDPQGYLLLRKMLSYDMDNGTRRATRKPTLDGSSVVIDNGLSITDVEPRLEVKLTRSEWEQLVSLHEAYPELILATHRGRFRVTLFNRELDVDVATLDFYIHEKLS